MLRKQKPLEMSDHKDNDTIDDEVRTMEPTCETDTHMKQDTRAGGKEYDNQWTMDIV
jgi:hypothetical protein